MTPYRPAHEQDVVLGFKDDMVSKSARAAAQAMWSEDLSATARVFVGCQYGAINHHELLKASAYLISLHTSPPEFPYKQEIMASIATGVRCPDLTPLKALRAHYEDLKFKVRAIESDMEYADETATLVNYPEGFLDLTIATHYIHAIEVAATLVELTDDPHLRILAVYAETMSAESIIHLNRGNAATPITPKFSEWLKTNIKTIYQGDPDEVVHKARDGG